MNSVKQTRSTVGRCSAKGVSNSRTETAARHERDLCVDVTKLPLNIADRCVRGDLSLSEAHHLLRPLVFYSRAIERQRVTVAAIGGGSVLAQPRQ